MSDRVIRSGNDAGNANIGSANCAYCSVGGLVGRSATEIMLDVYSVSGELKPSGSANDGSLGFAKLYAKLFNKAWDDTKTLEFQVEGIVAYLNRKGCTVKRIGGPKPSELLRKPVLAKAANDLDEGALFLVLTGDEDVDGWGITTLAHWTIGQKQNGKAVFYDYQLKISDDSVRKYITGRCGKTFTETGMTDYPVIAWGKELDDDDGRGMLLVVSK